MVTATQVEPSHQMGRGLGLSFPYATGQKPRRGGRWDEGHEKPSMRWGIRFPKLPPRKLTWQWKHNHLKMHFLLKIGIFQCHVRFQGCSPQKSDKHFLPEKIEGVLRSTSESSWIGNTGDYEVQKNVRDLLFSSEHLRFGSLNSFNLSMWRLTK